MFQLPAPSPIPVVLVVEDDVEVRTALVRLLSLQGLEVRAFDSGTAFLAAPPSAARCLVVDAQMPGGADGLAVLQAWRGRGVTAPAIVVTAWPESDVARAMVREGVQAVLRKPFDAEALLGQVRAAVATA